MKPMNNRNNSERWNSQEPICRRRRGRRLRSRRHASATGPFHPIFSRSCTTKYKRLVGQTLLFTSFSLSLSLSLSLSVRTRWRFSLIKSSSSSNVGYWLLPDAAVASCLFAQQGRNRPPWLNDMTTSDFFFFIYIYIYLFSYILNLH